MKQKTPKRIKRKILIPRTFKENFNANTQKIILCRIANATNNYFNYRNNEKQINIK